jgi:twitching motility protein PilT
MTTRTAIPSMEANMNLEHIIDEALKRKASDIFISAGAPLAYKMLNDVVQDSGVALTPSDTEAAVDALYLLAHQRSRGELMSHGDDDFAFSLNGRARVRASVFQQRGSYAIVLRLVAHDVPSPEALHIPDVVMRLAQVKQGLIIVSGPAGAGKSTTLAALIHWINAHRAYHIITLEDPIEYLHAHQKSLISQREIGGDASSLTRALRAALRQAPNVLLISEMRDLDSIALAITAAETGHLVLTTLHTLGAANTLDRMIDVFPAAQQSQVRLQLSMVLEAVVSQQLVKTQSNGLWPVFEVLRATPAVRTLIRDAKTHQLHLTFEGPDREGMLSQNVSLLNLIKKGLISEDEALLHSYDKAGLMRRLTD